MRDWQAASPHQKMCHLVMTLSEMHMLEYNRVTDLPEQNQNQQRLSEHDVHNMALER